MINSADALEQQQQPYHQQSNALNDFQTKEGSEGKDKQQKIHRRFTKGSNKARGIRERVLKFTPAWGSVTMGSGIPANLLILMPWSATHAVFRGIGAAFLILDMALLLLFSLMWIARYTIWPHIIVLTLRDNTHSLFIGTVTMGYITVASAIANYGQSYNLQGSLYASAALFWICSAMAMLTICVVPFMMMTKHSHRSDKFTAAWLLPFVPTLTVAAAGGVVTSYIYDSSPTYALNIWLASYIQLGLGFVFATSILVLYLQRLIMHHLPDGDLIVSTFLPIGAVGQAGYAAVKLGIVARDLFPLLARNDPQFRTFALLAETGNTFYGAGILLGLMMFGVCLFWLFAACASVISLWIRKPSKFSLGWWACTFPIGSMNYLTYILADVFDNQFFRIFGTILTATVCLLWTIVFLPTLRGFKRGTLFDAPCLKTVSQKIGDTKQVTEVEIPQPPSESTLT